MKKVNAFQFGSVLRQQCFVHRGYHPHTGEFFPIQLADPLQGKEHGSLHMSAYSDRQRICEPCVSHAGIRMFVVEPFNEELLIGFQLISSGRTFCFAAPVHVDSEKQMKEYLDYRDYISDNYITFEHYPLEWPFMELKRQFFAPVANNSGELEWSFIDPVEQPIR